MSNLKQTNIIKGETNMAVFMANSIMNRKKSQGLTVAQNLYQAYFINTTMYAAFKSDVDSILAAEGYSDCIVVA